jgi:tricorn protease
MIRKIAIAVLLLLPALAQSQVKLLRHPSYSKGKVAFSYLGDIWVANENGADVQRITDHKARDIYPRFSPDGSTIAFSSNREGNDDVFVVPATGGKPHQLTFHSAADDVVGWTPDGKRIVFTSARGNGAFPGVRTLWTVSADGGTEQPIDTDWGSWASYSADGSKLAFTRHPGVWSRKHYRGSYAVDLCVMDVAASKFTQLADPDYKGNYLWPMYGHDGYIYYVADQMASEKGIAYGGPEVMKSVNNIWKIPEKGGKPVQVTRHTDGNLYFPSMSADGKVIVYEDNFGLWKLDVASGKSSEIKIDVKSDVKDDETQIVTFANQAEGFNVSPSNKRAAIEVHGEIFTIATDRGEPQRVTETPWREENPRWSPDGKWIAFVSDRTGRQEIYLSDELGKTVKKVTDGDGDKASLTWDPISSKYLLWTGDGHKLYRTEIESGNTTVVASGDAGDIGGPQVSPDGKWLVYSAEDKLLRSRVYIKPMDGSAPERAIGSDNFLLARGAKWTPDGKKIVFLAGTGAPSMASLNRTTMSLYSVALTRIDKDPEEGKDINTEAQAATVDRETPAPGRGGRGGGGGQGAASAPSVEVKIEWDGMDRRIKQLTNMQVSAVYPSPDSRTYLFSVAGTAGAGTAGGGPSLYTMADDGTRITRLNTAPAADAAGGGGRGRGGFGFGASEPQWARDSRGIYFMTGGGIYNLSIPAPPADTGATPAAGGGGRGGRGGTAAATPAASTTATGGPSPRRINFTVRMEVDLAAERKQVFEEAWNVMKNRFYDPKMHGVDWAAAKQRYEPLLEHVADIDELQNVIMEMIGEMNASHTGISGGGGFPGQAPAPERAQTRFPGFDLAPDASGYFKVSYIYKKGPADHDYIKLSVGDFILSVNGRDLKTTDNYWRVFNLLPGSKLEFLVNTTPTPDGAWKFTVDPLTSTQMSDLQYQLWVDRNEERTNKLSSGRIGYLHIKAMDQPSLDKFQRDLLKNQDKKALIIDQRFNGGGGIDQELLAILVQRKQYQATVGRDSVPAPRPGQTFFGPLAVLQNERSASDAEMFPDGFRTLGLGKIVGVTTYGAVIGTGAFRLLDGSTIRTPGAGVFTASGRDMENYGVPPDVFADNTPSDYLAGHDRQIEKAIEVLTAEIK